MCPTKRCFAFSKIGFCADTKVFEEALNAVKFLGWLNKFGPAQNILGPIKGQDITLILQSKVVDAFIKDSKSQIKNESYLFYSVLNPEAKTFEKSWSLTTNSKFNAICCWAATVLHPNCIYLYSVLKCLVICQSSKGSNVSK